MDDQKDHSGYNESDMNFHVYRDFYEHLARNVEHEWTWRWSGGTSDRDGWCLALIAISVIITLLVLLAFIVLAHGPLPPLLIPPPPLLRHAQLRHVPPPPSFITIFAPHVTLFPNSSVLYTSGSYHPNKSVESSRAAGPPRPRQRPSRSTRPLQRGRIRLAHHSSGRGCRP